MEVKSFTPLKARTIWSRPSWSGFKKTTVACNPATKTWWFSTRASIKKVLRRHGQLSVFGCQKINSINQNNCGQGGSKFGHEAQLVFDFYKLIITTIVVFYMTNQRQLRRPQGGFRGQFLHLSPNDPEEESSGKTKTTPTKEENRG
jgi:hypothetical protein